MGCRLLSILVLFALTCAARADDGARAALAAAREHHRSGRLDPALKSLARAMRLARESGDARLSLAVAREAEVTARRLGANDHAMAYLKLAQEDLARLPSGPARLPVQVVPYVPPPLPLGIYSHRATVAAFRKRVKEDPAFLADLTRLKGFRDDPATTLVGTLEYPGVPVDEPRYLKDDYKSVSKALGYYKFALKLGRTIEDEFALATLYVNLTVLRTDDHPALAWVYGLTKTAAIAEAASRIIGMHVTGGAMDLTILALDKLVIDLVRRYDSGAKGSTTEELLGIEDDE